MFSENRKVPLNHIQMKFRATLIQQLKQICMCFLAVFNLNHSTDPVSICSFRKSYIGVTEEGVFWQGGKARTTLIKLFQEQK